MQNQEFVEKLFIENNNLMSDIDKVKKANSELAQELAIANSKIEQYEKEKKMVDISLIESITNLNNMIKMLNNENQLLHDEIKLLKSKIPSAPPVLYPPKQTLNTNEQPYIRYPNENNSLIDLN